MGLTQNSALMAANPRPRQGQRGGPRGCVTYGSVLGRSENTYEFILDGLGQIRNEEVRGDGG
jgi:hypothetical protein